MGNILWIFYDCLLTNVHLIPHLIDHRAIVQQNKLAIPIICLRKLWRAVFDRNCERNYRCNYECNYECNYNRRGEYITNVITFVISFVITFVITIVISFVITIENGPQEALFHICHLVSQALHMSKLPTLKKATEVDWVWLAYIRNNAKAGLLLKSCILINLHSANCDISRIGLTKLTSQKHFAIPLLSPTMTFVRMWAF